jgi:transforming growth factor-beta-induced protein
MSRRTRRLSTKVAVGALAATLSIGGLASAASAHGGGHGRGSWSPPSQSGPSIVDLALGNPDLSVLAQAVVKAGYADALASPWANLTVFAPTNDAFVALLGELGYTSLDEVPVPALQQILKDHVLPGRVTSKKLARWDVKDFRPVTLGGLALDSDRAPTVTVNDATVVVADVKARNGVVHVIDKVLLDPDPRPTIAELAAATPELSILLEAVTRTGLADVLAQPGDYTVFAPTNDAFIALLGQLGVQSLDDIDDDTLRYVLLKHVVAGELDAVDVAAVVDTGKTVSSLAGLELSFTSGPLAVNGNPIVATDVEGSNGTVHVISSVILAG